MKYVLRINGKTNDFYTGYTSLDYKGNRAVVTDCKNTKVYDSIEDAINDSAWLVIKECACKTARPVEWFETHEGV